MKNNPVKLLLSGYWGKEGWKEPCFSSDEVRVLNEAGLLRPAETLGHKEALDWALRSRANVSAAAVADAFLFSLTSRDLRYRSALGSFAHLQFMPKHKHECAKGFHTDICAICGFDENQGTDINFGVLNFERHKWGGVRHDHLVYMAYDLELFKSLPVPPDQIDEGRQILRCILDALKSSENFSSLKSSLGKIVKSNDSERSQLCEILAYAGILQPSDCPAFTDSYIRWDQRGDGRPKSDMNFPLGWWRGCGYREAGVKHWFPGL